MSARWSCKACRTWGYGGPDGAAKHVDTMHAPKAGGVGSASVALADRMPWGRRYYSRYGKDPHPVRLGFVPEGER